MYRKAIFPSSLLGVAILLLTAGNTRAGINNILEKQFPSGTGMTVSIPIKFIPMDENFFGRIGVDFDSRIPMRTVTTPATVPDGGTVLLGGIKRLSEGRIERGVPILNKTPYINRLFRNVGIGRETQSLMMMVTPRIIIQE